MMKVKFQMLALVFVISLCLEVKSQSQEKIYSVMMMNFAKGTQWPVPNAKGNFIIGVFEYPPLAAELQKISASLKLGNRKIEIREFETIEELQQCHMLFVPAYKARRWPDVLDRLGNSPTLLITNKFDFARKGAGINFVLIDGKLKYEINSKSIEKRGMKISSDLKGLGILIE